MKPTTAARKIKSHLANVLKDWELSVDGKSVKGKFSLPADDPELGKTFGAKGKARPAFTRSVEKHIMAAMEGIAPAGLKDYDKKVGAREGYQLLKNIAAGVYGRLTGSAYDTKVYSGAGLTMATLFHNPGRNVVTFMIALESRQMGLAHTAKERPPEEPDPHAWMDDADEFPAAKRAAEYAKHGYKIRTMKDVRRSAHFRGGVKIKTRMADGSRRRDSMIAKDISHHLGRQGGTFVLGDYQVKPGRSQKEMASIYDIKQQKLIARGPQFQLLKDLVANWRAGTLHTLGIAPDLMHDRLRGWRERTFGVGEDTGMGHIRRLQGELGMLMEELDMIAEARPRVRMNSVVRIRRNGKRYSYSYQGTSAARWDELEDIDAQEVFRKVAAILKMYPDTTVLLPHGWSLGKRSNALKGSGMPYVLLSKQGQEVRSMDNPREFWVEYGRQLLAGKVNIKPREGRPAAGWETPPAKPFEPRIGPATTTSEIGNQIIDAVRSGARTIKLGNTTATLDNGTWTVYERGKKQGKISGGLMAIMPILRIWMGKTSWSELG